VPTSVKVTIGEGEKKVQDLQLGSAVIDGRRMNSSYFLAPANRY